MPGREFDAVPEEPVFGLLTGRAGGIFKKDHRDYLLICFFLLTLLKKSPPSSATTIFSA
jgi:hypothetical protein